MLSSIIAKIVGCLFLGELGVEGRAVVLAEVDRWAFFQAYYICMRQIVMTSTSGQQRALVDLFGQCPDKVGSDII